MTYAEVFFKPQLLLLSGEAQLPKVLRAGSVRSANLAKLAEDTCLSSKTCSAGETGANPALESRLLSPTRLTLYNVVRRSMHV